MYNLINLYPYSTMSIVFLRSLMIAELLTLSNTAPKLGHPLFDPLKYEAALFVKKDISTVTSNDALRRFLRIQDKPDSTTKKPCLGYDYDDKLCKLLGSRIVCGYNKNLGQPTDSDTDIDVGNGCYVRGDRVECGYIIGPYRNSRRPSANSQNEGDVGFDNVPRSVSEVTSLKTEATISKHKETINILDTTPCVSTGTSSSATTHSTNKLETTEELTLPARSNSTTSTTATTKLSIISTKVDNTVAMVRNPTASIPMEKTKTQQSEQSTIGYRKKPKFMCVDKENSIFCYELNELK